MPNPISPETQAQMLAYATDPACAEYRNELIKHLITGNQAAFEQLRTQIESTSRSRSA